MKDDGYDGSKFVIRPSSVANFYACSHQWYKVHILKENTIPSARAAIGTAIHSAAETLWTDAIHTKSKDANMTKLNDAAIDSIQDQHKNGLMYDLEENITTAETTVLQGVNVFVRDIVTFTDIPIATEERYTLPVEHNMVQSISGTVDYISEDTIADLKTSKKKISVAGHVLQQTIYKMLAQHNGRRVDYSLIQGIALTKKPQGHILELEPNIPQAKAAINSILDTLDVYYEDKVDPDILFRGNTSHYLCSPKYCSLHAKCKYVNGIIK